MLRNEAFWRATVLLAAAGLGQGLHISAFAPSVPEMAATLAPGDQGVLLAQTAMTIPGLGMLLMGPVVGLIAERRGHRPVMLIGIMTFMLSGLAGLVITSPWLLIVSRFIVGVGATAMLTPTFALIPYYFDPATRDRLLGLSIGASALVGIPCSLIAGQMVKDLGWRAPFALFGLAIFLLLGAFFVITDKEGQRKAIIPPPAPPSEKPPLAALFGIYAIGVWMSINGTIPVVQTPFLVSERGFADPRDVALLVTSVSVGMIFASPLYGRLAAKFDTRALIALILGLFGIASATTGLFTPLVTAIAASALSGFAATYILPTCASYILTNLPSSTHGRAMGGLIGALFLGTFINQFVIYPLNTVIGRGPAFVFIGAVNGLGALIALGLPLLRRRSPVGGRG